MRVVTEPTARELEAAFALRERVFVAEQRVPRELERDAWDATAAHVVVFDADAAVATGRVRILERDGKIERVAVTRDRRGQGLGRMVMDALEAHARVLGATGLRLAAQASAIGFYQRLGYRAYGEPFVEAGIDHRWMRRPLSAHAARAQRQR
ncbi:MAG: GNAT family N-acetyltransferase [Proteobacteria bacterium]|nr:MAG: GNAT family N-acetyltransferase [Pseudomonadota bacterium]